MFIDFHTHIFPDFLAEKAITSLSQKSNIIPNSDGTKRGLIAFMDEVGVDISVVLSIATKASQERTINDTAISLLSKERLVPFGSVFPGSENAISELKRIKSAGIKGIKLHPEYQNFKFESEFAQSIYEECANLGLIVLFHSGNDAAYTPPCNSAPSTVAAVVKNFPRTTFVAAHFGSWGLWESVLEHLCGIDNLYFDTAFANTFFKPEGRIEKETARKIVSKHGVDKILLGSDMPWERTDNTIELIESLSLSNDEKDLIYYKNAKRILNI